MDNLNYYDIRPAGLDAYLSSHGWHFSKAMCKWAVSKMRDRNERRIEFRTKDQVEQFLRSHGIELKRDNGYDAVYVIHMVYADFFGSSINTDDAIAKYVRDYIDDPDGYEGIAFVRFLADCEAKGIGIDWEDMI